MSSTAKGCRVEPGVNGAIRVTVLCLLALALSDAKDREWQTGTLVQEGETREVAGGTPLAQTTSVGYVIQGQGTGFTVALPALSSTPPGDTNRPNVTIHGPIKYCYDKGRFYIKDEEGQEFEMTVMHKEKLPVAAPHPHRRWWVPWPMVYLRSMTGLESEASITRSVILRSRCGALLGCAGLVADETAKAPETAGYLTTSGATV